MISKINHFLSLVHRRQFPNQRHHYSNFVVTTMPFQNIRSSMGRTGRSRQRSNWFLLSSCLAATVHALNVMPHPSSGRGLFEKNCRHPRTAFSNFQQATGPCPPLTMVLKDAPPPDFKVIDDDEDADIYDDNADGLADVNNYKIKDKQTEKKTRKSIKKRNENLKSREKLSKNIPRMDGTSWVEKNAAFYNLNSEDDDYDNDDDKDVSRGPSKRNNRTFRQDFQGTRVFVKGIPPDASWQDLKDHFKIAGNVVFASVSMDSVTGESKGVGIVQFETSEMAQNAIRIMRNHPFDGSALYVREDVQEQRGDGGSRLQNLVPRNNRDTLPSRWECADDENSSVLSQEEKESVVELIKARDAARRRRNYDESDRMRQDLKVQYGVHLDDRLKQWWVSFDGSHVPENVKAVKGEGRWAGKKVWRQIPTTPENDACVNPELVNGLLVQRDIARKEKDFSTADALLEEARSSPDGNLYLRIHDESRTWRVWTEEAPQRAVQHYDSRKSAAEQCIDLVREKAPHKEEEIKTLLAKFPGREYPILKKLRKSLEDL